MDWVLMCGVSCDFKHILREEMKQRFQDQIGRIKRTSRRISLPCLGPCPLEQQWPAGATDGDASSRSCVVRGVLGDRAGVEVEV